MVLICRRIYDICFTYNCLCYVDLLFFRSRKTTLQSYEFFLNLLQNENIFHKKGGCIATPAFKRFCKSFLVLLLAYGSRDLVNLVNFFGMEIAVQYWIFFKYKIRKSRCLLCGTGCKHLNSSISIC